MPQSRNPNANPQNVGHSIHAPKHAAFNKTAIIIISFFEILFEAASTGICAATTQSDHIISKTDTPTSETPLLEKNSMYIGYMKTRLLKNE